MAFIQTYMVPAVIIMVGGYFLINMKVFFITKPKSFVRALKRGGASGKTLCLALAGTLGVGNIVGVAGALALGGAGSLFWMLLSSVFAMALKYAENALSVKCSFADRSGRHGGAMYYLKGKITKTVFISLCLICSFSLGSALQTKAAADAFREITGLDGLIVTLSLGMLTALVVFGGKKRIFDFAAGVVPVMSILYTLMCLSVIIANYNKIGDVFIEIISSAFNFRSITAGGGFAAVRYGIIRGLISNEAGCGTSPMAHSSDERIIPESAGCLGIIEVFVDTVLLCSLTGISLLCVEGCAEGGIESVLRCFASVFGSFSSYLLTASIALFAFATVVCWSYYGLECIHFLKNDNNKAKKIYLVVFCLFASFSGIMNGDAIWYVSDACVAIMTVINVSALFLYRNKIPRLK